ncbi:MAG: hypothetical protein PHF19_08905, partial [Synergistales bacterium]|nr:hypothetical protein [Synergistales bacterium]
MDASAVTIDESFLLYCQYVKYVSPGVLFLIVAGKAEGATGGLTGPKVGVTEGRGQTSSIMEVPQSLNRKTD